MRRLAALSGRLKTTLPYSIPGLGVQAARSRTITRASTQELLTPTSIRIQNRVSEPNCRSAAYSTMAASRTTDRSGIKARSPPFTQLVVKSMRELFPEELADRSWDNVGLLLDNVEVDGDKALPTKVLLTNDLTYSVAEEAIAVGASVIISYHPIIFRALKSLTCADPQQATLLLLASRRIAVYCPHTALDASPRGINAWLADTVEQAASAGNPSITSTSRRVLRPVANPQSEDEPAGYGLETTLSGDVSAASIIKGVGEMLGGFQHLHVVEPAGCGVSATPVRSVAVCAGSGADVMRGCGAEMLVTGEMSHHDALRAAQEGRIVVTTYHSNTERRFLEVRLRDMLEGKLREAEAGAEVVVSKADRDPFRVVDLATL